MIRRVVSTNSHLGTVSRKSLPGPPKGIGLTPFNIKLNIRWSDTIQDFIERDSLDLPRPD